jgi:hypothetical protein
MMEVSLEPWRAEYLDCQLEVRKDRSKAVMKVEMMEMMLETKMAILMEPMLEPQMVLCLVS